MLQIAHYGLKNVINYQSRMAMKVDDGGVAECDIDHSSHKAVMQGQKHCDLKRVSCFEKKKIQDPKSGVC